MDVLKAKVKEVSNSEEARNIYETEGLIDRENDIIDSITNEYKN